MSAREPLSDERLAEIRQRDAIKHHRRAVMDRRDLLAEVDRLRAELERYEPIGWATPMMTAHPSLASSHCIVEGRKPDTALGWEPVFIRRSTLGVTK